jgi:2-(1,2-epoxy-1,2-dihydrophenyl)acetyl-CoA isomerase
LAARLAALPAHAALETRALLRAAAVNELPAQLGHERGRQRALVAGAAFDEGLSAFLQKRRPVFPGR